MADAAAPDYEADNLLAQYLFFHYGKPEEQFPFAFGGADGLSFPQRCAALASKYSAAEHRNSALDLGCGVGAAAVALSTDFSHVIGLDYSHAFVDAANRLLKSRHETIVLADEGNAPSRFEIRLPARAQPDRVWFIQGDAQQLPADLGPFDLVLACNLLCRLAKPLHLVQRLPDLVKPGGTLLITTPLTWLDSLTPVAERIGSKQQSAIEALAEHFTGSFNLLANEDLPFLIREHRRKYQYSIAQASIWQRI